MSAKILIINVQVDADLMEITVNLSLIEFASQPKFFAQEILHSSVDQELSVKARMVRIENMSYLILLARSCITFRNLNVHRLHLL